MPFRNLMLGVSALALLPWANSATAADEPEVLLVLRNHRFEPQEVRVPIDRKIRLLVRNQDSTPEEFESHELNREKLIPGKGEAIVFVGPLKPGRYPFFGEFNEKTARGTLVAE